MQTVPKLAAKTSRPAAIFNAVCLIAAVLAAAVIFLPFAVNTSPWDAVRLHVPGDQGNWWHALIGAPFFLAFPMIWLRVRPVAQRSLIWLWALAAISTCATLAVETPFLLHLAKSSDWHRFPVLCLGLGILLATGIGLRLRRSQIGSIRACLTAITAAWLANAALCLVVYSDAPGPLSSRSGWLITLLIVWPMAFDIAATMSAHRPQSAGTGTAGPPAQLPA